MIADEQWFLAARSDSSAAFPEAPRGFVSETSCRESDPVRAVLRDRQAQESDAVLTVVFVPRQRSHPQPLGTPELPALLT